MNTIIEDLPIMAGMKRLTVHCTVSFGTIGWIAFLRYYSNLKRSDWKQCLTCFRRGSGRTDLNRSPRNRLRSGCRTSRRLVWMEIHRMVYRDGASMPCTTCAAESAPGTYAEGELCRTLLISGSGQQRPRRAHPHRAAGAGCGELRTVQRRAGTEHPISIYAGFDFRQMDLAFPSLFFVENCYPGSSSFSTAFRREQNPRDGEKGRPSARCV